jgi:hypothetical protein
MVYNKLLFILFLKAQFLISIIFNLYSIYSINVYNNTMIQEIFNLFHITNKYIYDRVFADIQ